MREHHTLFGGKLHIYRRANSSKWQCAAYVNGKNWRVSCKEDSLSLAKDMAEDWYLGLRGASRAGVLEVGKKFKEVADYFLKESQILADGQRGPRYIEAHNTSLRHLLPFFGTKAVQIINESQIDDYRVHRMSSVIDPKTDQPVKPAFESVRKEINTLRLILKLAHRKGWITHVPDMTSPFSGKTKISHRGWFSPEEYKQLYTTTRERARNSGAGREHDRAEELHDFVLFMGNTGLRPDEAKNLQCRDVAIETDGPTGERILAIEVRGKTGIGNCKSMPGAVLPFKRLRARGKLNGTDPLFSNSVATRFNALLGELGLKTDRDGNRRSVYSLRHSYISFRLMEGANIYEIAKNCRTSVEMIENHYAVHLKNRINAGETNRRSPKPKQRKRMAGEDEQWLTE